MNMARAKKQKRACCVALIALTFQSTSACDACAYAQDPSQTCAKFAALEAKNQQLETMVQLLSDKLDEVMKLLVHTKTVASRASAAGDERSVKRGLTGGLSGTHISTYEVSTERAAAGRVDTETLNVTNVYIHGDLFWHGRPWGPNEPTPVPTPVPVPRPSRRLHNAPAWRCSMGVRPAEPLP